MGEGGLVAGGCLGGGLNILSRGRNSHQESLGLRFFVAILASKVCKPARLGEGSKIGECPKVVRRGFKRSFEPRERKASCTGASCQPMVAPVQDRVAHGASGSWETFAPWVRKTFCTLS